MLKSLVYLLRLDNGINDYLPTKLLIQSSASFIVLVIMIGAYVVDRLMRAFVEKFIRKAVTSDRFMSKEARQRFYLSRLPKELV